MEKILLVDDELCIIEDRSIAIKEMGFECLVAKNGQEAIDLLASDDVDIVLTDQKMPEKDGFDVLNEVKRIDADIPVIIFTGYGTVELAVRAMKSGAYDYIQKPVMPEMMEMIIRKAIEYRRLKKENAALKIQIDSTSQLDGVIGQSPAMKAIAKKVLKIATADVNVLIYGESGTGKDVIARSVHKYSRRNEKPFIPLDCVALPATLLESELFGYEKGAFTGADNRKPGVFELAEGGTLFLDEITEMDANLQAKLLRVLQERRFRRLGGKDAVEVNVRIISATNRNPERALREGRLREDLYYRLNVVPIYISPLRERKEDIPPLVYHFINKYNPFSQIEINGITGHAMRCLKQYPWPGNIRELENIIQRIISLSDSDTIAWESLPEEIKDTDSSYISEIQENVPYRDAKQICLQKFSREYFKKIIKKHNGNLSAVARGAGISRKTLYKILGEYEIEV